MHKNRLIAITIIKNEENNYLRDWLKNIGKITDYHIFLDDASTDNTPQIITEHLKKHPGELHRRRTSLFRTNEPALRSELWEYTRNVAQPGDWILIVDADEFYDEHLTRIKRKLLSNKWPDAQVIKVSCLDMWNENGYRTDGFWSPQQSDVRIIRYIDTPFNPKGSALHMPPYPSSTDITKNIDINIPKIHLAYLRDNDKQRRYQFYTQNVSEEQDNISYKHALSILDTNVKITEIFNFWKVLNAWINGDKLYLQIYKTIQKHKGNN